MLHDLCEEVSIACTIEIDWCVVSRGGEHASVGSEDVCRITFFVNHICFVDPSAMIDAPDFEHDKRRVRRTCIPWQRVPIFTAETLRVGMKIGDECCDNLSGANRKP